MRHPHAVVKGQPRVDPPAVLRIRIPLPVHVLTVDAVVPFLVAREHSEQGVGVAVAGTQGIVGVVAEVVDAVVVVRAGLRLAVPLGGESELVVVPPLGPGQAVFEGVADVLVLPWKRPAAAARPVLRQVGPVAAAEAHVGEVGVLVLLDLAKVRVAGRAIRLDPRRVDPEARTVEVGVIVGGQAAGADAEAIVVLRHADHRLVDERAPEHGRVGARDQVAGEEVVHRADPGRDAVEARAVVTIEQAADAEAL